MIKNFKLNFFFSKSAVGFFSEARSLYILYNKQIDKDLDAVSYYDNDESLRLDPQSQQNLNSNNNE